MGKRKRIQQMKNKGAAHALRWARWDELKMSRSALGKILGLSRKEIMRIEDGRDQIPREIIVKIMVLGLKAFQNAN